MQQRQHVKIAAVSYSKAQIQTKPTYTLTHPKGQNLTHLHVDKAVVVGRCIPRKRLPKMHLKSLANLQSMQRKKTFGTVSKKKGGREGGKLPSMVKSVK